MESIAKDSFDYLNKIRQNPKLAVPPLEERLKHFKDKVLSMPN